MTMRDEMDFDGTPSDEDCAQVGSPTYLKDSILEFKAMSAMLDRMFGPRPKSVTFTRRANPHDFGTYYTFRVAYDLEDLAFVMNVENLWPEAWDDKARQFLRAQGYSVKL